MSYVKLLQIQISVVVNNIVGYICVFTVLYVPLKVTLVMVACTDVYYANVPIIIALYNLKIYGFEAPVLSCLSHYIDCTWLIQRIFYTYYLNNSLGRVQHHSLT